MLVRCVFNLILVSSFKMDQVEDAIEIVDSAREHKWELEGRKKQLLMSIAQVSTSAVNTKEEVETYFDSLQEKVTNLILSRKALLLEEIHNIEIEALEPLNACLVLIDEGIEESSSVVESGERLLNHDFESKSELELVKKFIASTANLSLDSVPEVPLPVEVSSISITFNPQLFSSIAACVNLEGKVCQQSPVQITALDPVPGGIVVAWVNVHDNSDNSTKKKHEYVYKLESYHGKIKINERSKIDLHDKNLFKTEYLGSNISSVVRNLTANSIYTFRVCRCSFDPSKELQQWSPWSVYQEKMTTMPAYTWLQSKDIESYSISEKCKVATRKSSLGGALYSAISLLVGFPITFKIEKEGKSRGKSDCIAICSKRDPDATGFHTKDGTVCVMSDGHVWVNGTCTQTKFSKFTRGTQLTLELTGMKKNSLEPKGKPTTYQAIITMGEHEAVFNWNPAKTGSFKPQNLYIGIFFQSPGWRVLIV